MGPLKIGQSGGASRWRVCYQRGLPRLVLGQTPHFLAYGWAFIIYKNWFDYFYNTVAAKYTLFLAKPHIENQLSILK